MTKNTPAKKKGGLLDRLELQSENQRLSQQVDRLTKLHEIGGLLNSALDLEKILKKVVDEAVSIVSAEESLIMLIDEISGELYVRAQKGFQEESAHGLRQKVEDSIAQDAILTKKSQRWTSKEKVLRLITKYSVNAVAYLPLIVEDKVIGVLMVDNRSSDRVFTPDDEALLSILANYAASAIRNARLVDDLKSRTNVLTSLHDTGRSILSVSKLGEVLEQIAKEAFRLLEADILVLYQYFSQKDDVDIPPIIKGDISEKSRLETRNPDHKQSSVFKLIKRGQPFYATDAKNQWIEEGLIKVKEVQDDSFIFREKIVSSAGIPLVADHETVGLLFINYHNKRLFSDQEQKIIELFSNQAAMAIQNARLLEEKEASIKKLSILLEVSQAISSSELRGDDELLQSIYKHTKSLMDVDKFYVALYDEENDRVNFKIAIEKGEPQIVGQGEYAERVAGNGLTEKIIHSRKPLLIPRDVEKWISDNKVDNIGKDAEAWLGVPMLIGEKVLGVIAIQSEDQPGAFDKRHQDILHTIASQTAIALENARLLQEQKLRLEELTALSNISLDITHELDQEILLQAIVRRAAELLKAPNGGLMLCNIEEKEVEMKYTHNLDDMRGYKLKYGQGLAGSVVREGKSKIINDYHHWKDRDTDLDKPPYRDLFKSVIQAPLIWQKQVIGVLAIFDIAEARRFNNDDKQLLERFANQASIAIQNAGLFKKKIKELEALRKADIALLSALQLPELLETILGELANLIQCDCMLVRLYEEEKEELVLQASRGEVDGKIPIRIKRNGDTISAQAARTRQKVVVQDVRKSSERRRLIETIKDVDERQYLSWTQSEVAVPLIAKGQLIGVMTAVSHKRSGIREADIQLVENFAGQAAIAILNAQLIQKSKQHTVLVAHQLKGPLQAIRGDSDYQQDYVTRTYETDERLKQFSQRLEEHFSKVNNEMDKFSFLTREDLVGGHKYVKTSQPIDSLVSEAASQFKQTAHHKGVEIVFHKGLYRLPRLTVDRENTLTVFTNLIENAVKYSFSNKTVDIDGERKGNRVFVSIANYGLGVLPEDEDRIFELYTQGKLKDDKHFVQGTGIGLWVARKIMLAHGGDIHVWSELFEHPELTAMNPETISRGFKTVFSIEWIV